MNAPQKRDYDSSRQYTSQPNKIQRINQVTNSESNLNERYEGDIHGDIRDDLISHVSQASFNSENASGFLCE